MFLTLTKFVTAVDTACIGRLRSGISWPASPSSWMMTSRDTWNKCRFNFNWCCCCLWCNSQYAEIVYYNYNASDSSKDLIRFRIFRKHSSFSIYKTFLLFTTQFCSALSQNISGSQFKLDKVKKLFLIVLSNC